VSYNVAIIEDAPKQAFALKEALEITDDSIKAFAFSAPKEITELDYNKYDAIILDRHLFDGREGEDGDGNGGADGEEIAIELRKNGYKGVLAIASGDWEFVDERNKPAGVLKRLFGKKEEDFDIAYIKKGSIDTVELIVAAIKSKKKG
jgi:hypothetical protein